MLVGLVDVIVVIFVVVGVVFSSGCIYVLGAFSLWALSVGACYWRLLLALLWALSMRASSPREGSSLH